METGRCSLTHFCIIFQQWENNLLTRLGNFCLTCFVVISYNNILTKAGGNNGYMTPLIEHDCEIKIAGCLEIRREVDACAVSI